MINFFYQAGYSGLALAALSLIAVFMAIRGIVLTILVKKNPVFIKKIAKSAGNQDPQLRLSMVGSCMYMELKGLYLSMYFLKLCAAIGPLLGLLGTVLGMVEVFSNLSQSSMPDPTALAGGIWEALLTTVMGLSLAIPSLMVHYFVLINLRTLRNQIITRLDDEA